MAEVDDIVGGKIRERRIALGMTQPELAEALGISFQQVQKYETGANRVSASRLWAAAKVLGVPVESFFSGAESAGREQTQVATIPDRDHRLMQLSRNFRKLDARQQEAVLGMVESMVAVRHREKDTSQETDISQEA